MNLFSSIQQHKKRNKFLEIFFLFVGIPFVLFLPISILFKIGYSLLGIIFILWISIKKERFSYDKRILKNIPKTFLDIGIRFIIIVVGTTTFLFFKDKESLFYVMLHKPFLWLRFSAIYVLVSVIPQELIYRTFFVKRYQELFKNELGFIFINALLFSFAHIWFRSWIVLGFTFVGGILFAKTYLKTKSIWLVILEHSLYGIWLYTVGYGKLFMFPV